MLAACRWITSSAGRAVCWPCGRPSPSACRRRPCSGGRGRGRGSGCTPAVYLVAGHRLTDEARVRAAWLWAGEGACACPARRRRTGTACWSELRGSSSSPCRVEASPAVPERPAGAAAGPCGGRRRRATRPVAHRRPADRAGDRGGRWPTGRPSSTGRCSATSGSRRCLPLLLPQHRPARVVGGGAVAGGRGGPGRLRRRAAAGREFSVTPGSAVGCSATRSGRGGSTWRSRAEGRCGGGRVGLARRRPALQRTTAASRTPSCGPCWDPLRFTWHDLDRRPTATLEEIEETLSLAEARLTG